MKNMANAFRNTAIKNMLLYHQSTIYILGDFVLK